VIKIFALVDVIRSCNVGYTCVCNRRSCHR